MALKEGNTIILTPLDAFDPNAADLSSDAYRDALETVLKQQRFFLDKAFGT